MGGFSEKSLVVSLGSGGKRLGESILNLDLSPGKNVDLVGSVYNLPFLNKSLNGLVAENLFEHLAQPEQAAKECFRVLKPGGRLLVFTPFIYPYHQAPSDFYRYTREGLAEVFGKFEIERILGVGPGAALINLLKEYLSTFLSFNQQPFKDLLSVIFLFVLNWCLLPLRMIDLWLEVLGIETDISGGYYLVARKRKK